MRTLPSTTLVPLLCLAILGCEDNPPAPDADLVVVGGTVIDGTGAPPMVRDVFIRDGTITALRPHGSAAPPQDAEVLDATGRYVIPGLADMHVHFSLGTPGARLEDETEEVLRRLVYYGVTTVLNAGATDGGVDAIRSIWERQERGELVAPTVYATGGHLTLPGTHPVWTIFPDRVREAAEEIVARTPVDEPAELAPLGIGISLVRTEAAARRAVRDRAEAGMHAIKITVETGPMEFGDDHPMMSVAMIAAIVDEAGKFGLPVFAHVSSPPELDAVLEAGGHAVMHAVTDTPLPSPETAALMRERSLSYVATLSLYDSFIRYLEDPRRLEDPFLLETLTDREVDLYRQAGMLDTAGVMYSLSDWRAETDAVIGNVGDLHRRGVRIVLGTDVGNPMVFPGFTVHEELEHLVEAGLSPMEALSAGALRAAEMLGADTDFGSLEVGKRADVVVLDQDPLADIRNSRTIHAVVLRGAVVDRSTVLEPPASDGGVSEPGSLTVR